MPPAVVSDVHSSLTSVEIRKLRAYLAETDTKDQFAAIKLLTECGWDLQKAVEKYVIDLTTPSSSDSPSERSAVMKTEDSDVDIGDDSDEEYEDEDDGVDLEDYDVDVERMRPPMAPRTSGFFPREFDDTATALKKFEENFNQKFPSRNPPQFFLEELEKALELSAELKRPLVLFVTNEKSISQNIFIEQVVMNEGVMSLIRDNFILFPWDVTLEENAEELLEELRVANLGIVGQVLSVILASQVEAFPVLLPVIRSNRGLEMYSYSEPSDSAEVAVAKLHGALEEHRAYNKSAEAIRREQEERQQIRRLQEEEYQASLAADLAKIEQKRVEEEEKRKVLEEEERKRAGEVERQEKMKSELPTEPGATEQGMLVVKFRLPEGKQMMRRFRPAESIQTLANFLSSHGYPSDTYKYFDSDFPKKNVLEKFENSMESTFVDAKWPAREQIFVEEI